MSDPILTERDGSVLIVTLDRTDRKNALTLAMYEAMTAALVQAAEESEIRAVLFRARGDTFCAGNDLNDFMQHPPEGEDSPVFRFLHAISTATLPLVAQVDGAAVGIGTTVLLHCDLVYASDRARFKMPFVPLGLVPEAASSLLVPRMAGHALASELLLLGETFDLDTALRAGIVSRRVAADQLADHALAQAHKLAALPPGALQTSKRLLKAATAEEVQDTMRAEAALFLERLLGPENREAFTAFFEKRPPDFSKF